KRFEEVEEMIQGEVEKTLASAIRGPLGLMLEIPKTYARLVRNTIVKRCAEREAFFLSHASLETICTLLESGAANRQIRSGIRTLIVDRGIFFLLEPVPARFLSLKKLEESSWEEGGCKWEIKIIPAKDSLLPTSWRELWQGEGRVVLPEGEFQLVHHDSNYSYPGGPRIKKLWGEARTPAFLRPMFPLIAQDGEVVGEFLSGKKLGNFHSNKLITLSLKFKLINN
ncbi:MAG: hypothetical protein ACHQT8_05990, partial [Chlamydiales bacterium]